ncbi:hypothetical protein ACLQ2N_08480 [Streptomyces sp. DT224]|uniref:hypothetical protein n=1 Tax=Streptomyces sp. DT224 TaxID=3393426 RepID=UPI003CEFDBAB
MDLTAGTRATAVCAALITSAGLAIVLCGIFTHNLKTSIGGAIFMMTALTLVALVAIRKWITDTSAERNRLNTAVREAEADRIRYVVAQATLEGERTRLRRDVTAERELLAARLDSERTAMQNAFEEEKNQLVCDTVEATVAMVREGLLDPAAPRSTYARVIGFPSPAHQRAAEEPARGATR